MRNLFKWVKPVVWILFIICLMQVVVPITYSYVPQFIKYVFDYDIEDTGASNTLPNFIKDFLPFHV